jgi:hypothetical protein
MVLFSNPHQSLVLSKQLFKADIGYKKVTPQLELNNSSVKNGNSQKKIVKMTK